MSSFANNFCLAISSPSGAGKSTICRAILQNFPNFAMSVSATTRKPRMGEVDGREYFFLDKPQFTQKILENYFIEYAEVFGNFYGTPHNFVSQTLAEGKNVLFDIDYQGVDKINNFLQNNPLFPFYTIFILPPSIEELQLRLIKRGLDSPEIIQTRIEKASHEIKQSHKYNKVFTNNNLSYCLENVFEFISEIKT